MSSEKKLVLLAILSDGTRICYDKKEYCFVEYVFSGDGKILGKKRLEFADLLGVFLYVFAREEEIKSRGVLVE